MGGDDGSGAVEWRSAGETEGMGEGRRGEGREWWSGRMGGATPVSGWRDSEGRGRAIVDVHVHTTHPTHPAYPLSHPLRRCAVLLHSLKDTTAHSPFTPPCARPPY